MAKIKYKNPDYIQFIRNRYCDFCGLADRWDDQRDLPINTPFHLKSRGSGGEDFYNTVTACLKDHILYEGNKKIKQEMKALAVELTQTYQSKDFWSLVKKLQNE